MKKEELMIGDWVYNAHNRQNEQVAEIGSGLVMLEYNDLYEYDEIEPIPMTSELLEKKGFKRVPQPGCVNPYHWMLEKYEEETEGLLYRIKAYKTPFRGMYVSIDNHADCETINFGKQIEHVHELQHAFRLCNIGIDL